MTLIREDIDGKEIPTTRPIIKPVENFLDKSPGISEKIDLVRNKRLIRGREFFGYEIGNLELLKKIVIARSTARGY